MAPDPISSTAFRHRCIAALIVVAAVLPGGLTFAADRKPNFVVILTDDQGYADLGCYGAPQIKTPAIDQMAAEGMRFACFYAAAPICTPTRAALMTGCYATRVGLGTPLHTLDKEALNPDEITLAELLREAGYATACIGKWHLGHHESFLPTRQGFDYYYGTPMGHMFLDVKKQEEQTDLFLRNEERIPFPPPGELTERLTEEAVRYVKEHADRPFFLYLAHSMPHIPLEASVRFRGTSDGGLYGDVIETIDWSTGEVLKAIREAGLAEDTYVIFTSDNGPNPGDGSPGPYRGGKHSAYEGGVRVPGIVWAPGHVTAGTTCDELVCIFDLYPTMARLGGATLPADRVIDGRDITPLLHGETGARSPHPQFLYYVRDGKLAGIRDGTWKLLIDVKTGPWSHAGKALYNLASDPGEQDNVIQSNPGLAGNLESEMRAMDAELRQTARPVGVAP